MSMFVYFLIAVHMNGDMWVLHLFSNKSACQQAEAYIQSLDKRPAHVYCSKILINPV